MLPLLSSATADGRSNWPAHSRGRRTSPASAVGRQFVNAVVPGVDDVQIAVAVRCHTDGRHQLRVAKRLPDARDGWRLDGRRWPAPAATRRPRAANGRRAGTATRPGSRLVGCATDTRSSRKQRPQPRAARGAQQPTVRPQNRLPNTGRTRSPCWHPPLGERTEHRCRQPALTSARHQHSRGGSACLCTRQPRFPLWIRQAHHERDPLALSVLIVGETRSS